MELSRLRRMVRARWWIVVAMALLGTVAAVVFTNYQNEGIAERHSATAVIEFIVEDEETTASTGGSGRNQRGSAESNAAAPLVETAAEAAQEVNATLLEEVNVSLLAVPQEGRLEFLAIQPSPEAAENIVTDMRDNYLAVDPTRVDVDAEIAALVAEATQIRERLDELEPPPEPELDPVSVEVQAQMDVLSIRIGAVTGNVGALQEELTAELEKDEGDQDEARIAELNADLQAITDRLAGLKAEMEALTPAEPEPVEFSLTPEEELEQTALEARMSEISLEFVDLQEQRESTNRLNIPEVVVTTETDKPTSRGLSALFGLLGGALAGLVAIVAIDRVQGTVWSRSDLGQVPILAEVPQHRSRIELRPRRYQQMRQKGVQSARSAILGLYHAGGPVTIGFTGLGTTDEGTSGLVLDLARSLAGVGRSVLVVDGQVGGLASYRDLVAGGSNLADLVAHDADEAMLTAHIAGVLAGTAQVSPNLHVLPGDSRQVDAVDILASKSFRELTERAIERFDIVMVVGPSALSPFAYVMTGLVSAYVIVTTMGQTRQQHIERLAEQFAGSRSRLIGAVLLGIRPRRGWVPASDLSRAAAERAAGASRVVPVDERDEDQGLLDRLGQSLASLAGDKSDT